MADIRVRVKQSAEADAPERFLPREGSPGRGFFIGREWVVVPDSTYYRRHQAKGDIEIEVVVEEKPARPARRSARERKED